MLERNKSRVANVDLMKGVCIFFVVLFHCGEFGIYPGIVHTIRCFYLPVFFFCAGLFFSSGDSFAAFVVKKINMLIVPYIFFALLSVIFMFFFPTDLFDLRNPKWYWAFFYYSEYDLPIWFLPAIFFTYLIYWLIVRVSGRHLWVRALLVLAAWSFGAYAVEFYSSDHRGIYWLFFRSLHISTALLTVPFMFVGHELRRRGLLQWRPSWPVALAVALSGMIVCVAISHGQDMSYYVNIIDPAYGPHLVAAFGGIACLWVVCLEVKRLPLLSLMGEYSLTILCTHFFGVRFLNFLREDGQYWLLLACIVATVAGLVLLPRYLPWAVGRKFLLAEPRLKRDDKARRAE